MTMKTKLKKFTTPRENVRLLIQPRFRKDDEEEDVSSSDAGESTPAIPSIASSGPSTSSIAEVPLVIRKEQHSNNQNSLGDGFRALLKVNDDCYEVDINDEMPTTLINGFEANEADFDLRFTEEGKNFDTTVKHLYGRRKKRISPMICLTSTRYSAVSRIAKSLGWKLVRESDLWNIYWTDSIQGVDMYKVMKRFQKVNHFPGMIEICRKDLLARNLTRMLRLFPVDYNFFPKTWCFPADLGDAINYSRQYKNKTFILKPDTGAQGKGIWLTKNLKEIKPNERMICQVYVNKPLLIDGYKFDLRVYTLVTSVDPLRVFVYNEGLARFATSKYKEPTGHNTSNVYMHLTNYSVNKHSRTFSKDDEAGSKRKLSTLNRILMSESYDVEKLWNSIDEIIVKTLLSAWPMLKHNYHACFPCHDVVQACFEILGFDILVDSKMKPLLLEVNHSPSFHTDEQIDREVKEALIRDTFNILNISVLDKKKILKEDKRRVQTRLLQKIRENIKPSCVDTEPINFDVPPRKVILSPNTQQISWEESHLGGFRRVMPAPTNPNKYTAFLILQNQSSIYSDTAASKRREEAAKQLRSEIIQRALKDQRFIATNIKKPLNDKVDSELGLDQKRTKSKNLAKKKWPMMNSINDVEERERTMLLSQRDFLIRSSGLVQIIFESFYRNELLSDSDREKFKELHDKIQAENLFDNKKEIQEHCHVHNRPIRSNNTNSNETTNDFRLPNINKNIDNTEGEKILSSYISSMPIINPSLMIERLQRVRGKYSELYRKTLPNDKFIS